jgi:hypothetical protein
MAWLSLLAAYLPDSDSREDIGRLSDGVKESVHLRGR